MIYLITSRENHYDPIQLASEDIQLSSAKEFENWISLHNRIQLDTETNVVDKLIHRELYVVQIGDYEGKDQWIFDIIGLSSIKLNSLKKCLSNNNIQKIIHNAMFEYSIIQKAFGIDIDKIRDTFLMSKILYTGLLMPKGFHGLAGCLQRYLRIDIDKASQTTFTTEPMSIEQILYAATDVALLGKLHDALQVDIDKWGLENTVRLECAVIRPFSDGLLNNLYLNQEKWRSIMLVKEKELKEIQIELFDFIKADLRAECEELEFIQAQDTYLFSWGSGKMKKDLMRLVYPSLPSECTALPAYKKFYNLLIDTKTDVDLQPIELFLARNFEKLELYFIQNHQQFLADSGLFIAKGTILLNLNSPIQTLQLFKLIDPTLEAVNKDTIKKLKHPLVSIYQRYMKASKLYSSYGQNFLDAVDEDGMLRIPDINQIVQTGRTSMKLFQLLPKEGEYRGCFYPEKGWQICGIDYSSQEIVVAATLSEEDIILESLKNGWDMHSICASMMFPKEWIACGEDPSPKGKPKTKDGDKFRGWSKAVSFG
jgi:hypothetical protein